jgi:hypothetical protein
MVLPPSTFYRVEPRAPTGGFHTIPLHHMPTWYRCFVAPSDVGRGTRSTNPPTARVLPRCHVRPCLHLLRRRGSPETRVGSHETRMPPAGNHSGRAPPCSEPCYLLRPTTPFSGLPVAPSQGWHPSPRTRPPPWRQVGLTPFLSPTRPRRNGASLPHLSVLTVLTTKI